MKNYFYKTLRKNEAGFFLVEILIALIISSIVAIGASVLVIQLINVKSTNANTVLVTKNIESAAHYLIRDVQMSEIGAKMDSHTGEYVITGIGRTDTEWLYLEWTWDDGEHRVAYEIDDEGNLYRTHKIGNSLQGRTLVAQYIDTGSTDWELVIDGLDEETGEATDLTVELSITASTGGYKSASQTRTIQAEPRVTPEGE